MEFTATPKLSFIDAVKTCLTKKYACFKGRARRSEYWWFTLFYSIIIGIPSYAFQILFSWKLEQRSALEAQIWEAATDKVKYDELLAQAEAVDNTFATWWPILLAVLLIVWLVLLLPAWGVLVRRLHDIGKSGWSMLIALIPIIGAFILLFWEIKDGDKITNQYGESPKYIATES